MPSKPRDEKRERDGDTPRSKEKSRHRSSRSSRKVDKAATPPERHSSNTSPVATKRRSSMPVPELERSNSSHSPLGSKTSLPYPSFSKAHSKEAVGSRENVGGNRLSYYTPDPTDLEKGKENEPVDGVTNGAGAAPPSPPETTMEQRSRTEKPKVDTVKGERKRLDLQKAADDLKKRLGKARSEVVSNKELKDRRPHSSRSRTSVRESSNEEPKSSSTTSSRRSKPSTPSKLRAKQPTVEDSESAVKSQLKAPSSIESTTKSEETTGSTVDSGATERPKSPQLIHDSTPTTEPESSPQTPTLIEPNLPPSRKETPAVSVFETASGVIQESPMPPPPPPPPQVLQPKVDYLMQHGGLPQPVPRTLAGAMPALHTSQAGTLIQAPLDNIFSPFHDLFDKYDKVMARSGSLAVATGYRSVARRLLDRLEAVFARDISSEKCACILCQASADQNEDLDDQRGVSWGEILEYVCGRQELPQWPPFVMDSAQTGLGISTSDHAAPMQKLDVDVPEEFREHYIRQSKKTKQSVDKWLQSQPHQASSPPQDVDDDTLTFAMLTRLEPDQRGLFSSLVGMAKTKTPSPPNDSDPTNSPPAEVLEKTSQAIQRLYRLPSKPRDPESAMYLLTNPPLHNVLATLAAISDGEWDLLTSGRFDGFLRSGADDTPIPTNPTPTPPPSHRVPSRNNPSRTGNPSIPPSRNPTPASAGAPITLDEETEIATLAEVEREIFLSMETLENAFESLHHKAESVRRVMRERGAGLALANQQRRGSLSSSGGSTAGTPFDPRMGTPASFAWESGGEGEEWDDAGSELWPDDSASNISSARVRRPRRRVERRTPALVEEDEEGEGGSKVGRR
ncbi:hypothetical protein ACLMJK_005713 [Lecanora helva]